MIRLLGLTLITVSIFLTLPALAQSRIFLNPDKRNETPSENSNSPRLFLPKEANRYKQRSSKKKNARSAKRKTARSHASSKSKSTNRFELYKRAQNIPSELLSAGGVPVESIDELMLVAAAHRTGAMGNAIKNRKARQERIAKMQKQKDQAERQERIWSAAARNRAQAQEDKPKKRVYKPKNEGHKKPRRLFLQND